MAPARKPLMRHPFGCRWLEAEHGMRLVGCFERRGFLFRQLDIDRGNQLLDVVEFGRADDRGGYAGRPENPGAGDLRGRDAAFARDADGGVGDREVRVAEVHAARHRIALRAHGVAGAAGFAVAGKEAASQRAPRDHAHALVDAQRDHLTIFLTIDQVVVVLHRYEAMPSVLARCIERLTELPRRHAARAEVADLARAYQRIERLERLLYRCPPVPSMDLVEVDEIGAQAAQRGVAGFKDVLAA